MRVLGSAAPAALILLSALGLPAPAGLLFKDVAQQAGLSLEDVSGGLPKTCLLETLGHGAAWLDYDRDGRLDVYIANGSTLKKLTGIDSEPSPGGRLYRNRGNGTFADVTEQTGTAARGLWAMGAFAADYDNDGYRDLFLTGFGRNLLLRNREGSRFEDVTERAGLKGGGWSTAAAFGDWNRDGFPDLFVTRYVELDPASFPTNCIYLGLSVPCGPRGLPAASDLIYRNNGDGTFSDVSETAGIRAGEPYYGLGVIFLDYDNDGFPDIYVANDATPANLWRNQGNGSFSDVASQAGCAFSGDGREQARMGVDAADLTGSSFFSLFTTNFSGEINTLFVNNGDGSFSDLTYPSGLAAPSLTLLGWGTGFFDFDNDGFIDLFAANGHLYPELGRDSSYPYAQPKLLFRGDGRGGFQDRTAAAGADLLEPRSSRGAAFADYDNDGDVDILVVNIDDRPQLLRNEAGHSRNFVSIELRSASGGEALGSRVEVRAGGQRQIAELRSGSSFLSSNDPRLHFGLGERARVSIRVQWPDGRSEEAADLEANRFYTIIQGRGVAGAAARRP